MFTVVLHCTIGLVVLLCFLGTTDALRCSEVEYCNTLRNRKPSNKYIVDESSIQIDEMGIIKFNLQAPPGNEDLQVYINVYREDIFRIRIQEFNSTRYQLSDIFESTPRPSGIRSEDSGDNELTIITTNLGSKLVVQFSPFNMELYREDVLEVVVRGDYLFIDNPSNSQSFSVGVVFPKSDHLYGLSQHATGLPLKYTDTSDPYRLYNKDTPNYPIGETDSIYGAVPIIYGHGPEITAGTFLHNAAQQFVDVLPNDGENMVLFLTEAGTLDLFVFLGPTPAYVLRHFLLITGVPFMPPLWSLGYHQCRYSYMTQEEVKDVVANFDTNNFQIDAIWLDIDHTNGERYFTWNPRNFSDPIEMQSNLSATNRKLVVISDPHIKVDRTYNVYQGAYENDLFIKNENGEPFEGECIPGTSSYMDFLNPEARDYYAQQYSYEWYSGSTSTLAGIWNDMNEPVVYDVDESVMPPDRVHYRDVTHREMHNAYGMLHSSATHKGLLERENRTARPFVLSRSHFAGSQRYAAIWTGDSRSTWEYLDISYAMCLNANLAGISFCGADIGGFNGNPDEELYQRWFQAGAWLPFFRVHSNKDTNRREPYVFPEYVQEVVRNVIRLRYKHIPVWYTLFYEYIRNKTPVIQPLFFQYTYDTNVFQLYNQLLVGTDIMVRAVTEAGVDSVPVYFPGGTEEYWIALYDLSVHQGGEDYVDVAVNINYIPIYYRGGSIIPRKDTVRPSTTEMLDDGYTLYVNLNSSNTAHGTLYIDDTTSLFYQDFVEYNYLNLDYEGGELTFTKIDSHTNSAQFELVVEAVVIHEVVNLPQNGEPGKYIKKEYRSDASGNLLQNIKFKFKGNAKRSIKLK